MRIITLILVCLIEFIIPMGIALLLALAPRDLD